MLCLVGSAVFAVYGLLVGTAFRSEAAVGAASGTMVIFAFLGNLFIPLSGVLLTIAKFTPLYGYAALARYPLTEGYLPDGVAGPTVGADRSTSSPGSRSSGPVPCSSCAVAGSGSDRSGRGSAPGRPGTPAPWARPVGALRLGRPGGVAGLPRLPGHRDRLESDCRAGRSASGWRSSRASRSSTSWGTSTSSACDGGCAADAPRRGAAYLVVLRRAARSGTVPFIGAGALSFLPFIVSFGMFALPLRGHRCSASRASCRGGACAVFVDADEGTWVVAIIVFAVGVMTGGIRLVDRPQRGVRGGSRATRVVAERERVARDVHDVLGHSLTVVTVKAELADRLVDLDPERAKAELVEIQALAARRSPRSERPSGACGWPASATSWPPPTALAGAGIEAHVPDDADAVDPRHRTVLAWVLREAVTNVVRHSDADACWVELDAQPARPSATTDAASRAGRRATA